MDKQELSEKQIGQIEDLDGLVDGDGLAGANTLGNPVFSLRVFPVSGLYQWTPSPLAAVSEQLRLDVDGSYPQMVASGTIRSFSFSNRAVHWIANLTSTGRRSWSGAIWFKDSDGTPISYPFPYTNVAIQVSGSGSFNPYTATVTFSGGGSANRVRVFTKVSPWFHDVEFEFDRADGVAAVTSVQTHAHPNRPATLPNQNLTIETVFSRTGFDVKKSGRDTIVPLAGAGTDVLWSDSELHDAMQLYWSRFANEAQWSMWTFFAWQHAPDDSQGITPDNLGGIMFDDIGPNHRQGTAIFNGSFIQNAPAGDPAPAAWVQRMRFYAAIHEMGHTFNLAHSWQKQHPPAWGTPWTPLANEPEALSIMNYPQRFTGGQTAFFADFEYRFSDAELLFMRHAPEQFVQMGNADWFDQHGFQQANVSPEPKFKLELRVNRDKPLFEFMEPVVLELKLTNISGGPQLIHENLLADLDEMTVIVKKNNRPARQFMPYAQYCFLHSNQVLMPKDSTYQSLFVSTGRGGWNIDEPGYYTVQMALHLDDEDVVSNALSLRVASPHGYDEEFLAQELFTDEVGRILAFDGSQYFRAGNDTLREITEKLSDRRVAVHARVALAIPLMREYKQLVLPSDRQKDLRPAAEVGGKIKVSRPKIDEARKELSTALIDQAETAAVTLGHIDTKYYVDQFSQSLAEHGQTKEAAEAQDTLHQTLASRKVLPEVLEQIKDRRDSYKATGRQSSRNKD